MRSLIMRIKILILIITLSLTGMMTERAAAAGEVIEFNDVEVPAVHLEAQSDGGGDRYAIGYPCL